MKSMNSLALNRAVMSRAVWEVILNGAAQTAYHKQFLLDMMLRQNELREKADYNTGSIGPSSAWCTYAIAKYFNPDNIAEVGTFIGCSTMAMAYGVFIAERQDPLSKQKTILTCDISNEIPLHSNSYGVHIEQFPRQSAAQMFTSMHQRNIHADLMNIDGRLNAQEMELLGKVIHERTVFVLDDFEGLEKGVSNAFALMSVLKNYTIVYPPERELLSKHGFTDQCFTAMLLPLPIIQLTNQ